MKKFRFVLVALLLAGVTAAFAFSHQDAPKVKRDTSWFQYSPTHDGGTSNPENYVMVSSEPTCQGSGALCAIEAPIEDGLPDLDNIISQRSKQP